MRLAFWAAMGLLGACPGPTAPTDPGATDSDTDTDTDTDTDADTDTDTDTEPAECPPLPAGVAEGRWGPEADHVTLAAERVVLMGGSTEVDVASRSLVSGAGGGDVLVLRATGSTTSYLDYLATDVEASPRPTTVRVLRIDEAADSAHPAVLCHVARAEAIWLAGGNQRTYLLDWDSALHQALRDAQARGIAIGGTSAGAMALSGFAFDARAGGVISDDVLSAPYDSSVSVSRSAFASPALSGMLVDTHFSQRDREGRMLGFLAHVSQQEVPATGLGLDERAALVIEGGRAVVNASVGRSVWLYRLESKASLAGPLSIDRVLRRRLGDGESLAWPPGWDSDEVEVLTVVRGVITSGG